jgi:dTMP kinase
MGRTWKPGIFAIEGMDGLGKSTLTKNLVKLIIDADPIQLGARIERFPSQGSIGKLIRENLSGSGSLLHECLYLLFAADARDRLPALRQSVLEGEIVLVDRHPVVSQLAYQPEFHPIDVVRGALIGVDRPDFTFVLDAPVEVAMRRIDARGESRSIYEDRERLERVRSRYRDYVDEQGPSRAYLVDVSAATPEEVAESIFQSGLHVPQVSW